MIRPAAAGAAALALLAIAPAAGAPAPTVATAQRCYLANRSVEVSGAGFRPGAAYTVTVDGRSVGGGKVRADGTLSGTLSSGALPRGRAEARHRIDVADGALRASAVFDVSSFRASFSPRVGNPRTLAVRYSVRGLGIGAPSGSIVYLHYVDPRRRMRRTVAIGRTAGPCGSLPVSHRHRLFPLRPSPSGTWQLQFDLSQVYSPQTQPRIVRVVAVG